MAEREPDLVGVKYQKDADGVIKLDCGGDILASDNVAERNRMSRVFIPPGRKYRFSMMVETDVPDVFEERVQASGVAKADVGNMCSGLMRSRVEQNVAEPVEPVIEVEP